MKTLTLLRHAKSGWDDGVQRDFDRPLNPKGRRAAQTIGRHLRREGLTFDHVVASPAQRVVETMAEVEAGYGASLSPGPESISWDKRLYLAPAETLLDVIRELPDAHARVLLVGHNPGLEDLVLDLVPDGGSERGGPRDAVELKYPTAALAELTWADGWSGLRSGGATLTRFTRPRDLDPSLGPDEA